MLQRVVHHPPLSHDRLRAEYGWLRGRELLTALLRDGVLGRTAVVSSFGAESAVLLHMVAEIAPTTPVLFLDTGKLFDETLAYQETLSMRLGLSDVRVIRPEPAEVSEQDADGELWSADSAACCHLRKVVPLERAAEGFDTWITGRKRFQGDVRTALGVFEDVDGCVKVNPLAGWLATEIKAYLEWYGLPQHPLVAQGYPSIGCAPCTTPVAAGEDPRAGRWRGQAKTECGIHFTGGLARRAAAE